MAIELFAPILAYCERTGPGFWAEPLNALSNAAFLLAAGLAFRRARAAHPPDRACLGLAVLVAVVGIGSFLFHTLAVAWAMLADVIPIALFIYAYLALALCRFLCVSRGASAAATGAFALFGLALTPALDGLSGRDVGGLSNGSIEYLPALLVLFGVALGTRARRDAIPIGTGRRLAGIGAVFVVSLCARTADRVACAALPVGTHAVWHVLNAVVLYALVATAVRHREVARGAASSRDGFPRGGFLAGRREFLQ